MTKNVPLFLSFCIHLLVCLILFFYYLYQPTTSEVEPVPDALEIHTFRAFNRRPLVKFTKLALGPKSVINDLADTPSIPNKPNLLRTVPVSINLVQLKLSLPAIASTSYFVPKINLVNIQIPMVPVRIGSVSLPPNTASLKASAALNLPIFDRTGSSLQKLSSILSEADDLPLKTEAEKVFLRIAHSIVMGTETNLVDIVLLIDASKSMADDIAMVRNHIDHITQRLTVEGIDFTMGLAIFRYTSQLNPIFRDWTLIKQTRFTQKMERVLSRIRCHGGERTREAVIDAISQVKFRANTSRRFILVTDEVATGSYDLAKTLDKLSQRRIRVDVLGVADDYQVQLAKKTGGLWFPIANMN